ncbi:hypothetical protein CTEN210_10300 [Chaetoceros tenuissimus]|uniref:Uncharacterized protein n=1 Tax=Chaetoceros tenuissimus TaxID=426638 RepID=A0AAD3H8G7_9STRA|nr:hypothetical protein CTEN210_10300 [Chaetoceros tenuissimus]
MEEDPNEIQEVINEIREIHYPDEILQSDYGVRIVMHERNNQTVGAISRRNLSDLMQDNTIKAVSELKQSVLDEIYSIIPTFETSNEIPNGILEPFIRKKSMSTRFDFGLKIVQPTQEQLLTASVTNQEEYNRFKFSIIVGIWVWLEINPSMLLFEFHFRRTELELFLDLYREKERLTESITVLRANEMALIAKSHGHETAQKSAETRFAASENLLQETRVELRAERSETFRLQQRLATTTNDLNIANQTIEYANTNIDTMYPMLQQKMAEIARLNTEVARLTAEVEAGAQGGGQSDDARELVRQLQAQVQQLTTQREEDRAQRDDTQREEDRAQRDDATARVAELTAQVTQLTIDRDDATARVAELTAQVTQLTIDREDATARVTELTAQVTQSNRDIEEARLEAVRLTAANERLTAANDEVIAEVTQLRDTLLNLQNDREDISELKKRRLESPTDDVQFHSVYQETESQSVDDAGSFSHHEINLSQHDVMEESRISSVEHVDGRNVDDEVDNFLDNDISNDYGDSNNQELDMSLTSPCGSNQDTQETSLLTASTHEVNDEFSIDDLSVEDETDGEVSDETIGNMFDEDETENIHVPSVVDNHNNDIVDDPNFATIQEYLKNDPTFKEHVEKQGYKPEDLPIGLFALCFSFLLYNYQNRHREEVQIDPKERLQELYQTGYLNTVATDARNFCSRQRIDDAVLEKRMIEEPTKTIPMFAVHMFKRNVGMIQCQKHYEGIKYFFLMQWKPLPVGGSSNSEEFDRIQMAEMYMYFLYTLGKRFYKQNCKQGASSEDDKYYRETDPLEQTDAIARAFRHLKVTKDSQGNEVKNGRFEFEECDSLTQSSLKTALADYMIQEHKVRVEKSRTSEPVRLRPRVSRPGVMHLKSDKSVTLSPIVSQETMKNHVKRMFVIKTSMPDLGILDIRIEKPDIDALEAIPDVRKRNYNDLLFQSNKVRCQLIEIYTDRMEKSILFKRRQILGEHKCLVKVIGGKVQNRRIPLNYSIEAEDGEVLHKGTVLWQQIAACYNPENPLKVIERIHEQDPNKYITDSTENKDVIVYEASHECKFAGCCCYNDIINVPKIINSYWKNNCFKGEECKCPTECLNVRTLLQWLNRKLKFGRVIKPATMMCQPCTTTEQ